MRVWLRWLGALALVTAGTTLAAEVPDPEAHLGFRPGADYRLATWGSVVEYFRKVDAASDRVVVRELGRTTEGRPYLVAIVSSPTSIADLGRYRDLQERIATAGLEPGSPEAADAIEQSRPVVIITCSIHSSEPASTLMAVTLLHDLATGNDPATREVLDSTILLLVPSANPDGVDKVADWYERSKGHPWEGDGMPELYHKYAGHDTNRDWFMLNLAETRLLTRLLYREWFPTVSYDVHQMGRRGARLFVPPFYDPINPNLDRRVHQGIALAGTHMAADLAAAGKSGVLTHALYDNWWNGGNRTTPQRHNIVGVLTEAAGVKLATPVFLEPDDLRGGGRGFADHRPAANFVDPWPGGWWRLGDIVDYERICARSLLTLAARYKTQLQTNYLAMGRDAIEKGQHEPPFAWVVPAEGRDPGTATEMVGLLHQAGIRAHRAPGPLRAGGVEYPAGSWVLPAAQPYRAHLKDMMERQLYPARFTADGKAEPPYDVAGWTLPLLMDVRAVAVAEPFAVPGGAVARVEAEPGRVEGEPRPDWYALRNRADDDFLVLNALLAAGVEVERHVNPTRYGPLELPAGSLRVRATEKSRAAIDEALTRASSRVIRVTGPTVPVGGPVRVDRLRPQRIGVYRPWVPSMDEGWTRLVLERFRFPYATLRNADVRAGALLGRVDVLLIPSIEPKVLRDGFPPAETEPAFVGGLGREGADALREFVREGGTLVCLEDSCPFAIEELDLPVANALKDLPSSVVFGPGSIVRVRYPRGGPAGENLLALGMPEDGPAYFDRSLAFDVLEGKGLVAARYATAGLLESGWLLGAEKVQGKSALVEVASGSGRVILFGFPPQNRGQSRGTFRLLFNALLRGGMAASQDRPPPAPSTPLPVSVPGPEPPR